MSLTSFSFFLKFFVLFYFLFLSKASSLSNSFFFLFSLALASRLRNKASRKVIRAKEVGCGRGYNSGDGLGRERELVELEDMVELRVWLEVKFSCHLTPGGDLDEQWARGTWTFAPRCHLNCFLPKRYFCSFFSSQLSSHSLASTCFMDNQAEIDRLTALSFLFYFFCID